MGWLPKSTVLTLFFFFLCCSSVFLVHSCFDSLPLSFFVMLMLGFQWWEVNLFISISVILRGTGVICTIRCLLAKPLSALLMFSQRGFRCLRWKMRSTVSLHWQRENVTGGLELNVVYFDLHVKIKHQKNRSGQKLLLQSHQNSTTIKRIRIFFTYVHPKDQKDIFFPLTTEQLWPPIFLKTFLEFLLLLPSTVLNHAYLWQTCIVILLFWGLVSHPIF